MGAAPTDRAPHVAVVGAGPAGLAAAHALAHAGVSVSLFEAGPVIGGLARTVRLWGRDLELGSHILAGGDARAAHLWRSVAGSDALHVPLRRAVLTGGRLLEYPFRAQAVLAALGPIGAARAAAGLLGARLSRRVDERSAEGWLVARFGRPLFEVFFRDYAEKLWGTSAAEIDAEFARTLVGAGRVSPARARGGTPDDGLPRGHFLHPRGGTGVAWERLAAPVRARGAIHLATPVLGLAMRDGRVAGVRTAAGEHAADAVVASLPLARLLAMLPGTDDEARRAAAGLRTRGTLLVYLRVSAERPLRLNWAYVYDARIAVGRITSYRPWEEAAGRSPADGAPDVVALEYWCDEGDVLWVQSDDEAIARASTELVRTGLLGRATVHDGHVVRLRGSHPVPDVGHLARVDRARAAVDAVAGLETAGRHATFSLDSMALALGGGLAAADRTLAYLRR